MKKIILPGVAVCVMLVGLLAGALGTDYARAIQGGGVGGVPASPREDNPRSKSIFVYELNKGEQVNDAVQVINNTPETKTLLVYAVDSQTTGGGSFTCAQKADAPIAVGTWIDLAQDKVTLKPNSKQKVGFTLRVPDKAPPGEQNGCIVIQDATSPPVDQGNGIKLSFRSAIRVAVTVPGKITKDLDFTGFSVTKLEDDSLRMSVGLRNNGNVSLDTDVRTKLKTLFGNTVRSAGGEFPVLSESEAKFNFEVDKIFWGGWYKARASAEYNSNTSESIGQGSSNETIYSDETVIFVAPQPLALAVELLILFALLGSIAFFILRRRHYRKLYAKAASYTVKRGDTINSIAKAHKANWKKIAKLNNLKAPYTIEPGSKLKIPASKK